jgi:ethanolamine permease
MEYILTPAVIVSGIGGYLTTLTGTPEAYAPLWWLACYVVFVAMNAAGVELSFRFGLIVTLIALATLIYYWAKGLPHLDLAQWATPFWPQGINGIFPCLPFALWFYLAIEQLPLAAEESHDPVRDIPRGLRYGLFTLIACAFLTLLTASGTAPGAAAVGKSSDPLASSLGAFAVLALAGLIASFHTIIYAYGRQIYSLSRAGYFPVWLSKTHGQRQTPQRALIAGAFMGYAAALAIHFSPRESPVGAVLLNMAVFGAVLAYVMQMASFLRLRSRFSHLPRPYLSPLGKPGAWLAMLLATVTLGALFANVDYRKGVYGALGWFAVGLAWFALVARHKLILSPEEEFAEEQRRKQQA